MKGKKDWMGVLQKAEAPTAKTGEDFEALLESGYREIYEKRVQEAVREALLGLRQQMAEKAAQKKAREEADFRQRFGGWQQEAAGLQKEFPEMDFAAELENPMFRRMLESGVGVKDAYQACHFDELMEGVLRYTAMLAQQAALDGIQANRLRPEENGARGSHGAVEKLDVKKLTAADRRRLAEEARRHPEKRISFV